MDNPDTPLKQVPKMPIRTKASDEERRKNAVASNARSRYKKIWNKHIEAGRDPHVYMKPAHIDILNSSRSRRDALNKRNHDYTVVLKDKVNSIKLLADERGVYGLTKLLYDYPSYRFDIGLRTTLEALICPHLSFENLKIYKGDLAEFELELTDYNNMETPNA